MKLYFIVQCAFHLRKGPLFSVTPVLCPSIHDPCLHFSKQGRNSRIDDRHEASLRQEKERIRTLYYLCLITQSIIFMQFSGPKAQICSTERRIPATTRRA